jgi:hypothetical protein
LWFNYLKTAVNLVVAAIVLWNTVYLEKAVDYLKQQGMNIPEEHLQHLSPLGWEHINLRGDYIWNLKQPTSYYRERPLRVKEARHRQNVYSEPLSALAYNFPILAR